MGQSTSVERGTSSSLRQRPNLEKNLRDKDKCATVKERSADQQNENNEMDKNLSDPGAQVFRSYHVKDRIDSLIEEYLTENTASHDSISDSEDNTHAVSSTEDTTQTPSSSSLAECDQDFATGGTTSFNGCRNLTTNGDRKSDEVDSTNGPVDSNVDKSSNCVNKVLKSIAAPTKMDGPSSLTVYGGSHGKTHTSPLSKTLCGPSSSSELNHRKSPKKQMKLQTLIDRVLESSLGSPKDDEKSGLLKSLAEVENDEREINRLSFSKSKAFRTHVERHSDDNSLASKSANKVPKVELGCSKDGLENLKTNIHKAFSARPPRNGPHPSHDAHAGHNSAPRHHSSSVKTEHSVNHSHGRHQDMKGVFNVQQIIERVIKEADSKNEFGDDRKRLGVQPTQNVSYNLHPSHRDNMAVVNNRSTESHSRHRNYHSAVPPYGVVGSHQKVSEERKSSQQMYQHSDRQLGSVSGNRDYRYAYGQNRDGHHMVHHSSSVRDLHPSSHHQTAPYLPEHMGDTHSRANTLPHKAYKRHSPPPLVRISDAQGSHTHRQQYGNKYPTDQCLPPPAKIRKEQYHDHMEAPAAASADASPVYRGGPRMQMTANAMHGNNGRGPDNIHMRPMYSMPVQMGLPFRGTLGPLPGPRSTAWVGAAEHNALSMQQMRHNHVNQPVHVTPRYPVSKHPNGVMPQRLSTQMMPSIISESPIPQHSMSHHNSTHTLSPSVASDHKQRPAGSITKGTAPPPQLLPEPNRSSSSEPDRRSRRSNEELPLDLSKKPSSTPSPAASSSDGGERLANGEPNCMSTHIKSLEESFEKYFHDYGRNKVPLDKLSIPEGVGDHQVYIQQRLLAEAHAQAQVHVQAQAHAHAIAQAQAHAHAQEQAHVLAQAHARGQAQLQQHPQSQINTPTQNFQMHSSSMREHTPSREVSYSNSPRPPLRQDAGVSPRQTSPRPLSYSSVIQSPSNSNLHTPELHHQKETPVSSPLSSSDSSKQSSKNMKQISKHEPIQSLLGSHAPTDILYLICKLCGQTYGSPYGFRRHFRNQHGFEPQAHHTQVQTISETRSARTPSGPNNGDLPPEIHDSPSRQHPSATTENQHYDRLPVIDRHSPSIDNDSLFDQKSVVVNGVLSDSRSSSVLSAPESKSDASSGSEDKCSRQKLPPGLDDGERRFLSCQECGEKFQLNDFGLYKKHCRAHDKERQVKLKCSDCRSNFCESHQEQRTGAAVKGPPHLCHLCSLFFPNPAALAQHIEMDHKLEEIQQHDLKHAGDKTLTMYECITCKKQLKDLKLYMEHKQHCLGVPTVLSEDEDSRRSLNISASSPPASSVPEDSNARHAPVPTDFQGPKAESDENKSLKVDETSDDPSVGLLWKKKKTAIKLTQPEGVSNCAPVFVNGDSKDSMDESGDLYRHKKFSRLPAKRRDSDLESLESLSSNKKLKLDVPSTEENKRASSCSSTAPSPAGSSVRSACSSPNSAIDEPSTKADFKRHSKFAKGMKYVTGLNAKGDSLPSVEQSSPGPQHLRDKTRSEDSTVRSKRSDKKDKGKKNVEKTEARHQLPFVWDRVTRSKAGKHAKK